MEAGRVVPASMVARKEAIISTHRDGRAQVRGSRCGVNVLVKSLPQSIFDESRQPNRQNGFSKGFLRGISLFVWDRGPWRPDPRGRHDACVARHGEFMGWQKGRRPNTTGRTAQTNLASLDEHTCINEPNLCQFASRASPTSTCFQQQSPKERRDGGKTPNTVAEGRAVRFRRTASRGRGTMTAIRRRRALRRTKASPETVPIHPQQAAAAAAAAAASRSYAYLPARGLTN
jgi:hypothetical protein